MCFLDGSYQKGRSDGAGAGLGQNEDFRAAAGLRGRADRTSPAGSGRAVYQEQRTAGQRCAQRGGSCRNATPRQQLGRGFT